MTDQRRRKRKRTTEPLLPKLKKNQYEGPHPRSLQAATAKANLYTISQVSKMIDRAPSTIRKWLRYEESPKPSQELHMPNTSYPIKLWTDDDVALLIEWRDSLAIMKTRKMVGGPFGNEPRKYPKKTKRRIPGEPFYGGVEAEKENEPRFVGTTKTRLPPKESFAEFWARQRGGEVEEIEHDTGTSVVILKRIKRKGRPDSEKPVVGGREVQIAGKKAPTAKRKKRS